MARNRDIAGLLTGIPSNGFAENMMQMSRELGSRFGSGVTGMMTGDVRTPTQRITGDIKNFQNLSEAEQRGLIGRLQARGETGIASQLRADLAESARQKQASQRKATILQSLQDLGLKAEADLYSKGAITDATASNLILSERKAIKVAEGTKNQQLAYLINQGIGKDDPLYQDIDAGLKLTSDQLSAEIKKRNKMLVPEYSSKNLKLMNVEGAGQQNVGTYTIDNGRRKQEVYGYMGVTPDGNLGLIPVDPNTVSSTTSKGIDISGADVNRAHTRLTTAGSRFKGKEKKWLLGAFSTDWDEAWSDLSADDKNTISTLVAQETKRNQQELNMDFAQAEEKAIKEVFVDKLRKSKLFELGEAEVMTADEIEEQRKKDLEERLKNYQ